MRGALILNGVVDNVIEYDEGFEVGAPYELRHLGDDEAVGPGWRSTAGGFVPPPPVPIPAAEFAPMSWATDAQAELTAQRRILDLLLLGGLDDGGTIDGAIGDDLPDTGGSLDDLDGLDGLDWTPVPDSGETLDALEGLT